MKQAGEVEGEAGGAEAGAAATFVDEAVFDDADGAFEVHLRAGQIFVFGRDIGHEDDDGNAGLAVFGFDAGEGVLNEIMDAAAAAGLARLGAGGDDVDVGETGIEGEVGGQVELDLEEDVVEHGAGCGARVALSWCAVNF